MLKTLFSLFKRSDSKPPQAVRNAPISKSKPKVVPTRIGELGEHKINIQLDQLPKECKYLSDLLIPNSKSRTGYSQIDHAVISPYCLFVIETKNYNGEIKGGRTDQQWSVSNRYKMYNPLKQNYGHIKAIESLIQGVAAVKFISLVSFTMRCRFSIDPELRKIHSDELVVYDVELSEFISRKLLSLKTGTTEPPISAAQIQTIYEHLVQANITDAEIRKLHVQRIKGRIRGTSKLPIIVLRELIEMIKQLRSWWKDTEIPNLIGRKKVDFSIFRDGTHIPVEFHPDFLEANQGQQPNLGEGRKVRLIYEDRNYEATLFNIDQKSAGREALQLRYNGNQTLKNFLIETFSHSYAYIMQERANQQADDAKKPQVVVPEDQAEYIDFFATGVPFEYRLEFITYQPILNVWWVNQGTTIQAEKEEGILWAPLVNSQGRKLYHWETMTEVKQGDIILHYSNKAIRYVSQVTDAAVEAPKPGSMANTNWQEEGRLVRTKYVELIPSITLQQFNQQIMQLKLTQGPLHSGGGVNQGYLFRFSRQGLQVLQSLTPEVNWPDFTILDQDETTSNTESLHEVIPILPPSDSSIATLLHQIQSHIRGKGFFSLSILSRTSTFP